MPAKYTDVKRRIEKRMRELRIENFADLAKILARKMNEDEMPPSNIHNWGNRGSIPVKYIFALAAVLDCSPEWLMNGENKYTRLSTERKDTQIYIPIYKEQGGQMDKTAQADNLTVDKEWFHYVTGLDYRETYRLIRSSSDSMQPTINQGDMVLIDTAVNSDSGDGLYYITWGGRSQIKRLAFAGESIHILSDSSKYSPATEKADNIVIVGQVRYIFNGKRP